MTTAVCSTYTVRAFGMNGVSWAGVASYGVALAVMALFFARDYRRLGR